MRGARAVIIITSPWLAINIIRVAGGTSSNLVIFGRLGQVGKHKNAGQTTSKKRIFSVFEGQCPEMLYPSSLSSTTLITEKLLDIQFGHYWVLL